MWRTNVSITIYGSGAILFSAGAYGEQQAKQEVRQYRVDELELKRRRELFWHGGAVMSFSLDASVWSEQQFSGCDLGDKRRTKRLIKVATQVANNPSASIPNQMEVWRDVKATYRLFDCEDVTFQAIAEPHWEQTRKCASGRCLILDDTTELDFGKQHDIQGLSNIGSGSGSGFLPPA